MNPVNAAKEIEKNLQDYIRRTLPVERADPAFSAKLNDLFAMRHLMAQDPYLELMPPYRPGTSLQQLVNEKVICQETADIFALAFLGEKEKTAEFILYSHQEAAIRAVCQGQQNLVVCSGTGSGKTECFLIPLVNFLVRQWIDAGRPEKLDPGVRTMILYPMNALVNDQVHRLRSLLRHAPYITFGKYTGELDPLGAGRKTSRTNWKSTSMSISLPWSKPPMASSGPELDLMIRRRCRTKSPAVASGTTRPRKSWSPITPCSNSSCSGRRRATFSRVPGSSSSWTRPIATTVPWAPRSPGSSVD